MQISDHSPLTFSSPRSRNWRKPPPTLLDLAEDRFHRLHAKGVTLGPRLVCNFRRIRSLGDRCLGMRPRGAGETTLPWRV